MSQQPRTIENVGALDYTSAQDASVFDGIELIQNVGAILVPQALSDAFAKIPLKNVGDVIIIPSGANVKMFVGQTKLTGESLAAAKEDEIWIVVGQIMITTVVQSFGGRGIQVSGQILAPRGSETALSSAIQSLKGQLVYLPTGARFIRDSESWSREFLELLPEPTAFCISGKVELEDDITVDLLKAKITEICLTGKITAPKALVPMLQVLTTEKTGKILVK